MLLQNLNLKVFIQEVLSFGLVGIISIFIAVKFRTLQAASEISAAAVPWWQFLIAFGIGTAVILGLMRIAHGGLFLRAFFYLALFSGISVTFSAFLKDINAIILSLVIIVLYAAASYIWLHNAVLILALSGIAALIGGSVKPWSVVLLLVVMSVYDYIAVYKTKHMVKMARTMIAGRAIFAMIFPEHWHGFKMHINEVHPGENFMMLGTGDFVFPIILASSALVISQFAAWLVFAFSLFGLLAMHLIFISQKIRRPMSALPPLAAFAIIGFLIAIVL